MDLCTVHCVDCDADLAHGEYDDDERPDRTGICFSFGSVHTGAHPTHALSYRRETPSQVEARQAGEAVRQAEIDRQTRAQAEALQRRHAETGATSLQRATTARPGPLLIGGKAR